MDINQEADALAQKIKHYMITKSGRRIKDATIEEFYLAFCSVIREELMIHWTASLDTAEEKKARMLFFLSMEYLPGRFLHQNIVNISAGELVKAVLTKLQRNFSDISDCEPDAGLGNGGLGRLASCFLDSLATQHYPARGYGLRYQYGIFEQEIWDGKQIERPDCWLLNANPWEARRDTLATHIHFSGTPREAKNKHGDTVYLLENADDVRALPFDTPILGYNGGQDYSVVSLRLWSTKESPRNFSLQRYNAGFLESAVENTSLTDVLYPNDNTELGKRVRLKQEFLLVSASLHDILRRHMRIFGDMSTLADKTRIQINDTHPALVVAELIRSLTKNYDFSWKDALDACQQICSYTNHTLLREALEEWDEDRLKELLPRQHLVIQRFNQECVDFVRKRFPGDEERVRRVSVLEWGQVRMAHLAIFGSHKVNGVAALHTELLKKYLFKDFYELFPEKFVNVTNGVTQRRWLLDANPELTEFIKKRIGEDWVRDFSQISKLHEFAGDLASQNEFLEIKKGKKREFLKFLRESNPVRDHFGKMLPPFCEVCENALFDMQIKRIHEYKRQLLNAIHLIFLYLEIINGKREPTVPRLSIFGGKAAPGYVRAKQIMQLISAIARKLRQDERVHGKLQVVFVENYNVTRAEKMIPAADLSEQISTAGLEASGTGNMKLTINGALTIGTRDGANIEMEDQVGSEHWPFRFGAEVERNKEPFNPQDVLSQDEDLRLCLETLKDGTFSENDDEKASFESIYQSLTEKDTFRVIQDFRSYYETQKKVDALYLQPQKWAELAIHNIASMGFFSVDRSIQEYAKNVWDLSPIPPDPDILNKVRNEYSEHDRCRIGEGT